METIIRILSEINIISITVRLLLAMVCSGIIGVERGKNGRPAGFRTHMLVCIGSTIVMMTNQYISMHFGGSDPTRMAAQVVSGIGFLGAGTIIVTRDYSVRGLTTAATLWSSACMGLAIGVGFYEGAILGCLVIWVITVPFHAFSTKLQKRSLGSEYAVMFYYTTDFSSFLNVLKKKEMNPVVYDIGVTQLSDNSEITTAKVRVTSHIDVDDEDLRDYMCKLNCTCIDDEHFS